MAFSVLLLAPLQITAAASTETNEAAISYAVPAIPLVRSERSEILIDRFLEEVTTSDRMVFDRFTGPSSRLYLARRQNNLGYGSFDRFNNEGANMFASIGLDSLRTAAVQALPLDLWLSDFVAGTIGNPEEEHVQLTSISYSAVRSSWEGSDRRAGAQWGFRPWRTNPYLYFLAHAGRLDGRPLVTFEGRAGYTLLGSSKVEGRLTLQLPDSFRIAGSASVDPAQMRSHDHSTHVGVTLERVIRARGLEPEAVFYVGFRSGVNGSASNTRQENLIVAGLSRRW